MNSDELFYKILEEIRMRSKDLNDDELYEFHRKLKDWCNKLI